MPASASHAWSVTGGVAFRNSANNPSGTGRAAKIMPGGTVEMRTPGGGGHGPVAARLPELLIADREDGIA